MTQIDFLAIIVKGTQEHYDFLSEYFYVKCLQIKRTERITPAEFFKRLESLHQFIHKTWIRQYSQEVKAFESLKPRLTEINPTEPALICPTSENCLLQLASFSNGKFSGTLNEAAILHIKTELLTAAAQYNPKKPSSETSAHQLVIEYLHYFMGYWKGEKIMTNAEYRRLIEYALFTVINGRPPEKMIPIEKGNSGLRKVFYQQSVYRMWLELKIKYMHPQSIWADFLTRLFEDRYVNSHSDMSRSFSNYPGNYEVDAFEISFEKPEVIVYKSVAVPKQEYFRF